MVKKTLIASILLTVSLVTSGAGDTWPENLNRLKKSLCLVEYYLPQAETNEIQDDTRIKQKITGILVDEKGLVITSDIIFPANIDIVARNRFYAQIQSPPEDITVSFEKDEKLVATLVGVDEDLRIAFIRISQIENLPEPIAFMTDSSLETGDPVYLIQHLNGRYNNEVIVTAQQVNSIQEKPWLKWLSVAALSPLSAGGLVVDQHGEPIGVVYRNDAMSVGSHFDIDMPMNSTALTELMPAAVFGQLLADPPKLELQYTGTGKSWLGIQMQVLTSEMAAYWGLDTLNGIIIMRVMPNSPAEKGGLQIGDIITNLGELQIRGEDSQAIEVLRNHIRSLPEGPVAMTIWRDQRPVRKTIILESSPKSQFFAEEYSEEKLRFTVKELTQDIVIENDLDFDTEGVWVSRVEEAGAASLSGLTVEDLILSIDNHKIRNLEDFKKEIQASMASGPQLIQFFIKRQDKTLFIYIKPDHPL